MRYGSGSGSGSFYHQAKIVKNSIPTVFWLLYDFLSLTNDVNVASKSNEDPDPYQNVTDPQHMSMRKYGIQNAFPL
jgi:hypothetical protein